jgi:hypothetical protein
MVTIRIEIFRAAIFILSASPRDLDSAAVAAKMSIPVKEKIALIIPVLPKLVLGREIQSSLPFTKECSDTTCNDSLHITGFVLDHVLVVEKRVRRSPIFKLSTNLSWILNER